MWRNSLDYSSWKYWWILMKFCVMVSLRVKVLHQIYCVQDQTHNLWQARVLLIFTRRKCPCFICFIYYYYFYFYFFINFCFAFSRGSSGVSVAWYPLFTAAAGGMTASPSVPTLCQRSIAAVWGGEKAYLHPCFTYTVEYHSSFGFIYAISKK